MKIYVIKNNLLLGTLEESSQLITFTYSESIDMKKYVQGLKDEVNESTELFPIFENMLPEHEQLKLLKSNHNITTQIEVLLYLNDIHGSYEFYTEKVFSKLTLKPQETFTYNDVKTEILDNEYTFPNILNTYSLNIKDSILYPEELANSRVIGLSGFQYKFSVIKDDSNNTITFDTNKSSNYFMKPYNLYHTNFTPNDKNRSYIPYLLINEHIFMTLARDFGFDIPYNGIIKHKTDYHYIIKRYDRYKNSKIDHQEILTLMNKSSDQKHKVSMKEVINTAKEFIDSDNLINLYKFIVFSIIIGHGDLHAKNLSLIYYSNHSGEDKMLISPYYDISTTKIYKDTKHNDIGLKIGNKRSNIKKEAIIELASFIGIEEKDANELINTMGIKFIGSFKDYITALPREIKILPYYINRYRAQKPLETILEDYYENRSQYINEFLLDTATAESNDDIWE